MAKPQTAMATGSVQQVTEPPPCIDADPERVRFRIEVGPSAVVTMGPHPFRMMELS